jgi:DNA-binding YbaB/EbfC family protein
MVDFNNFLQQAQMMQKKIQDTQNEVKNKEYIGKSGGSLVLITINGQFEMKKVQIDDSMMQLSEKGVLEDLIVTAFNDAKNHAEKESKNSFASNFGDIQLPDGFKLPF